MCNSLIKFSALFEAIENIGLKFDKFATGHYAGVRYDEKTKRYILLPIISSLILTTLEFICGNLLETLFHRYYWNYSNLYFSFGKYIALEVSIVWGLVSYLVIFINSKIEKYIKKIPKPITIILSIIFIIDLVFTFITNL